jgi:hypothetical protein
MAEMLTLNDWRMVNMMLDDRNMYDQHVIDEVYDKLQSMVEAADEYVKRKFGKEYEVGFDVKKLYDRLIDYTVVIPMLYVAKPSDCIEQSLGVEQPTAVPLDKPWHYGSMEALYEDAAGLINRVNELDAMRIDDDE